MYSYTDSILLYVYFTLVVFGVITISHFYALYFFMWVFVLSRVPLPQYQYLRCRSWAWTLLPGMIDSAISGQPQPGELLVNGMVQAAGEEANLPASLLRERFQPCDVLASACPPWTKEPRRTCTTLNMSSISG